MGQITRLSFLSLFSAKAQRTITEFTRSGFNVIFPSILHIIQIYIYVYLLREIYLESMENTEVNTRQKFKEIKCLKNVLTMALFADMRGEAYFEVDTIR